MDASSLPVTLGIALVIAVVLGFGLKSSKTSQRLPLPPGPKGVPILGNINDLPKPGVLEAHHWLKHKDLYGPISSVSVMGSTLVIVNDAQLAFELLDKRSLKHSSRPKQLFGGEMVGWENSLGLSPYNDRFRTYRKNMSRIIGSKPAAARYNPLQEAEVGHFLVRMLKNPNGLLDHIRKEAGSVILKIAYGYTTEPFKNDILVDAAGEAMDRFGKAGVPGAFMVDMIPFLRHIPEWFPGAGFQKVGREWAAQLQYVTEKPYAFVKHQMAEGRDGLSFLSHLLEIGDSTPEEKHTNKWSAMSLYTAGSDTTVSSIACFYLAMTLFPEAQRKAQEEIDRLIGKDRLPGLDDRPNLPYMEAMLKEVFRWHPVAPMALPHTSTEDDDFEGYFIPKDALIFANVWHFTHDAEIYDEPMTFLPERYLEEQQGNNKKPLPDPRDIVFGFGRRVCPGRNLAENAMWLNIAQSLAVFDIKPKVDANGNVIKNEMKFTQGVVSHPEPFEFDVRPRSARHEKLVLSLEEKYPWQQSDSKILEKMEYS